jgi:hypothetical protein
MFTPANSFDMPAATAKSLTRVEEPKIGVFGRSPVAGCPEFNEASVCSGFAAWPVVTHRECHDATATFNQNDVTQTLCTRRSYLAGQVKTRVNRFSYVSAPRALAIQTSQVDQGSRLPECDAWVQEHPGALAISCKRRSHNQAA